MKNLFIYGLGLSAIMALVGYFVIPGTSYKLYPAIKFGFFWGLAVGIVVFVAAKLVSFIVRRG